MQHGSLQSKENHQKVVASPETHGVGSLVLCLSAISAPVPLTDDPLQVRCDAQ